MKICIDAGHGGHDPGAVAGSVQEKTIALSIARAVGNLLSSAGAEVSYTRKTDVFVSLGERAESANRVAADLFLSIHCNSSNSLSANGVETLVYGMDGVSDALGNEIALDLSEKLNLRNRGVKVRRDLVVLNSTNMPAILVETAFLSNEADRKKLLSYQQEFANSIADTVCRYYKLGEGEEVERYKRAEQVPEWGRKTVQKVLDKGYLSGNDKGELNLSEDMVRMLVVNDRAGLYGK